MTPAQLATIKADILANPDLNAQPNNSDGAFEIARLYNLPASPTFSVWRTDAPVDAILDAINWSLYTPSSGMDDSTLSLALTAAQRTTQLLAIQTKQMNLQGMLLGRTTLNAAKVNIRAGLRDAVTAVPSGAAGAATSPGGASGATVLAACVRNATRIEKLLAAASQASDTTGTTTARVMTFEGAVSYQDIETARNS